MIQDILKPKDKSLILADLLETDPENILNLFKLKDKWYTIYLKYKDDSKFLDIIYEDIFKIKDTYFKDIKSTGLLGLRRNFYSWKNNRMSNEGLYVCIFDWFLWFQKSLNEFYINIGKRHYLDINDDIYDILYETYQKYFDTFLSMKGL